MSLNECHLYTPEEVSIRLAEHVRRLRLNNKWTQATLAKRSGVTLPTLRRFERTGLVTILSTPVAENKKIKQLFS